MPLLTPAQFEYPRDTTMIAGDDFWGYSTPNPDRKTVLEAVFGLPYRVSSERSVDTPTVVQKDMRVMNTRTLESWWGITTADEARMHMQYLLAGDGHSPGFDAVMSAAEMLLSEFAPGQWRTPEFAERRRVIDDFLNDLAVTNWMDPQQIWSWFDDWLAVRTHPLFPTVNAPALPDTTRAWDIMRVEATGGTAAAIGLISTQEYSEWAGRAVSELQRHFSSWADAAASFWWGRAIWAADSVRDNAEEFKDELENFNDLFTLALSDPGSPWRRFPLHL